MMISGSRSGSQQGFALLEVLITGIIVAIAVAGLAVMLSRGLQFMVAQGDTRVALHLAQQKIEKLAGLGWSATLVGDRTNSGCTASGQNNEPCYNETFSPTNPTPDGLGLGDAQGFIRLTCVRTVLDNDPGSPADPVEPPSAWTCPSCATAVYDPTTGACTSNCNCRQTKRIKVAVIPVLPDTGDATTRPVDPDRVTLEAVVTPIPRP